MSDILHLFRKDLRRLRWGLLLWTVVVLARLLVATAGAALAFGDFGLQMAIQEISTLLAALDVLLLALLVSWLVHDEPLVGADAFWLTRPIDRNRLFAAKAMFAALFLVGLPAAAQAITAAIVGGGWRVGLRVAPLSAAGQTAWVLALFVLAVLTPTLVRYFAAIVGCVAGLVAIVSTIATVALMTRSDDIMYVRPSPIPDMTGPTVLFWLLSAVAGGVIVYQYRNRRAGRAIVGGIVGVAAALVIAPNWPWHFLRASEPDPGPWAHDTQQTVAAVDPDTTPHVSDMYGVRDQVRTAKLVALPIRLTNLPPGISVNGYAVRSQLALPGGTVLRSAQSQTAVVPRAASQAMTSRNARLEAGLGDVRLLASGVRDYAEWPVLLRVSDQDYARYGAIAGRLTADIDAFVYRSRVVGALRLVAGAAAEAGSTRFTLVRVLRRSDGCTVLVRQSFTPSFGRPGVPRSYDFVLQNRARREAVFGDTEHVPGISGGMQLGMFFVTPEGAGSGFLLTHLVERYPEASPLSATVLDGAWLDQAELAIVETTYAGRVSRSIAVDDFRMVR